MSEGLTLTGLIGDSFEHAMVGSYLSTGKRLEQATHIS